MTIRDALQISAARTHAATGTGRSIRLASGLSLTEVADAVGTTTPTIFRWENAQRRPRGAPAARWADLLEALVRQHSGAA